MEINVIEAKKLREKNPQHILLDVRDRFEYEICKIKNSINIPLSEISQNLGKIDKNYKIIIYCHHGVRSMYALKLLQNKGFKYLYSLKGGINEWADKIDPSIQKY